MHRSIEPCIHPSIYPHINLSIHLSGYLPIWVSTYPSACLCNLESMTIDTYPARVFLAEAGQLRIQGSTADAYPKLRAMPSAFLKGVSACHMTTTFSKSSIQEIFVNPQIDSRKLLKTAMKLGHALASPTRCLSGLTMIPCILELLRTPMGLGFRQTLRAKVLARMGEPPHPKLG